MANPVTTGSIKGHRRSQYKKRKKGRRKRKKKNRENRVRERKKKGKPRVMKENMSDMSKSMYQ